jgi:hypothetical protein
MLLLAYNPDITGLSTQTATKSSRLHRLYDFIVETQTRRAEHESRALFAAPPAGPAAPRLSGTVGIVRTRRP